MNFKKLLTIAFLVFALSVTAGAKVGIKAPDFSVVSGTGTTLTSLMLQGKVVIGFYEHRNAMRNEELKRVLNTFHSKRSGVTNNKVFRLAVTDGREANFITRGVWNRKLSEKSKEMGITVYGDWNGSMLQSYGFPSNESIFIIIDKKGFIRYLHAGRVPESGYASIKELIIKLSGE